MRKVQVLINKPFQLGFAILEWSKFLMYRTYAQLKDHFKTRMRMMYTDTDSIFLNIESPDAYAEIRDSHSIRRLFDLSKVPETHSCPGFGLQMMLMQERWDFFKDETKGNPIIQFVALKPKMYSFTTCKPLLYQENIKIPEIKGKRVVKGLSRAIFLKLTHQNNLDMYK